LTRIVRQGQKKTSLHVSRSIEASPPPPPEKSGIEQGTVHQNQTFTTNFIDLDENMSVDEPTIIKRTRNVLSDSSSSETAQPKTKKGNAVEKTNSEDEVSNLMLDNFRITLVEFEKLTEYYKQRTSTQSSKEKTQK
jgi:hypothetical protein